MRGLLSLTAIALGLGGLAACAPADGSTPAPQPGAQRPVRIDYKGVETRLLGGDLVEFRVSLSGGRSQMDVADYATCAAAQYALIRGYGFAQHVKTEVQHVGATWKAKSAFLIADALPPGIKTIDAQVAVGDCKDRGIPTV